MFMRRDFILFALFFVLFAILFQLFFLFGTTDSNLITGRATDSAGLFSMCLGHPILLNFSDCPTSFNQSTRIEDNAVICEVGVDQIVPRSVLFYESVFQSNGLYYRVFENGTLIINGSQEATYQPSFPIVSFDNHTIIVGAFDADMSGDCVFNVTTNFSVTVLDINDPPHFISSLPIEDVTLREGQRILEVVADSFDDVDIRPEWSIPLTFNYYKSGGGSSQIIKGFEGSYVILESSVGNCPIVEHVIFEAVDPGGLVSDPSNVVRLEVECSQVPDSGGAGPPGAGGGFGPCTPEWRCGDWYACLVNGTQSRLCEDIGCGGDPKTFWRDCEYIEEVIEEEEEFLVVDVEATCFDGIRNCHVLDDGSIICEEGVDCGGPCDPCRRIELPALIIDEESDNMLLFFALLVVFVALLISIYLFFKKDIGSFVARIGWWITRKKRKQIFLGDDVKEDLLKDLNKLYTNIFDSKNKSFLRKDKDVISAINLSRKFLFSALSLSDAFTFEDVRLRINKKVFNDSFKSALSSYSKSLFLYELKSSHFSRLDLLSFIQETRMLVLNTGKLSRADFNFKAIELDVKGSSLDRARCLAHNSYLALCFSEVISAKKNYHSLLGVYEELSYEEQVKIHAELSKIYDYVKTVLSWI